MCLRQSLRLFALRLPQHFHLPLKIGELHYLPHSHYGHWEAFCTPFRHVRHSSILFIYSIIYLLEFLELLYSLVAANQ